MAAEVQAFYRIHSVLSESEMAAAQLLMQLSDEDNSNTSINNCKSKNRNKNKNENKNKKEQDGEFDGMSQDEITSKKIEEIFGKEEDFDQRRKNKEIDQRPRKKRYRSLESIYSSTMPMTSKVKVMN